MFATVCLGVDVSKRHLDLHLLPANTRLRVGNDAPGYCRMLEFVSATPPERIVLEASGGYETGVLHHLVGAKQPATLVNPQRVRHFAKSRGVKAKNDRLDAKVLAQYGMEVETRVADPGCKIRHVLKQLVTRRRQLVDQHTQQRNHMEHADVPAVAESIRRSIKHTREEIKTVEALIADAIAADAGLKDRYDKLTAAAGVGRTVASILVTELPELGTLHHSKLSALVGVAPFDNDSGENKGKRTIRGGRHLVRCALYMSTLVAVRREEHLRKHYKQLLARGKPKKVAIVACMNKRLSYLNSLVRVKKVEPKA